MDDDILTGSFVLELGKLLPPGGEVSPQDLSIWLGLGRGAGNAAMMMGFVGLNPQGTSSEILFKYVAKKGQDGHSALNLRRIFVEKEIEGPAALIENEFKKRNIAIPSRADAVLCQTLPEMPSPPSTLPGSEPDSVSNGTHPASNGGNAFQESEPMEEP